MSDLHKRARINFIFENHLRRQNYISIEFRNTVGYWKWSEEKKEEETVDMGVGGFMMDDDMVPMVANHVADPVVDNPVADPLVNDPSSKDQLADVLGNEDKNHRTCFESDYNGGGGGYERYDWMEVYVCFHCRNN